jgi:hypothetical protein
MSNRIATKGAIVKHGSSVTPTTTLSGVRRVELSDGSRGMINATCHDSTSTKEYIPEQLRDTLGLNIVIAHDPADAGHEAIRAAYAAITKYYFTLVMPDAGAAQYALAGYITNFLPGSFDPESGLMEATISFKADSVETYTQ